jgi:hypothetical protein
MPRKRPAQFRATRNQIVQIAARPAKTRLAHLAPPPALALAKNAWHGTSRPPPRATAQAGETPHTHHRRQLTEQQRCTRNDHGDSDIGSRLYVDIYLRFHDRIAHVSETVNWRHTDAELLDAIRRAQDALNAQYGLLLGLIGELLGRGVVQAKRYADPARLLQDLQRISRSEAVRRVDHAKAIGPIAGMSGPPPPLPVTAAAVAAGAIGVEHLEAIRRTMVALPPGVAIEDRQLAEQCLVDTARTFDPGAVGRLGRGIVARLDQDGRPPTEIELRHPVNELHWVTRRGGELALKGRLCTEGGALLTAVLSPLAKPHPAVQGELDLRGWTDAHHLRHWASGGATSLQNLVLLCGPHHRLLHHSDWTATIQAGQPQFTPPAFIDPNREPRHNPVHDQPP